VILKKCQDIFVRRNKATRAVLFIILSAMQGGALGGESMVQGVPGCTTAYNCQTKFKHFSRS